MTDTMIEQRWERVKWGEAGQVAALLEDVTLAPGEAAQRPGDWWAAKVAAGDLWLATRFLAMALPRLEAIGWAAQMLETAGVLPGAERAALDAAARWIQVPDDDTRRAAWDTAMLVAEGPARFIGAAIFFSGGSIAPADCGMIPPPAQVCGIAVGGTILGCATRAPDRHAFLRAALDIGARIATGSGR